MVSFLIVTSVMGKEINITGKHIHISICDADRDNDMLIFCILYCEPSLVLTPLFQCKESWLHTGTELLTSSQLPAVLLRE